MPPHETIGPWGIRLGPRLRRWLFIGVGVVLSMAAAQAVIATLTALGVVSWGG